MHALHTDDRQTDRQTDDISNRKLDITVGQKSCVSVIAICSLRCVPQIRPHGGHCVL